jgi:hypothetical protein
MNINTIKISKKEANRTIKLKKFVRAAGRLPAHMASRACVYGPDPQTRDPIRLCATWGVRKLDPNKIHKT